MFDENYSLNSREPSKWHCPEYRQLFFIQPLNLVDIKILLRQSEAYKRGHQKRGKNLLFIV
jgi:hypothetical protein